jgi:hypothetical protein
MDRYFAPPPPTLAEERAAELSRQRSQGPEIARAMILEEADELGRALTHLRERMIAENVPTNIEIIDTVHEKEPLRRFLGRVSSRRNTPHFSEGREGSMGRGWVISTDSRKNPKQAIAMLESGEIKIGFLDYEGKLHIDHPERPRAKGGKGFTELSTDDYRDARIASLLNLNEYPIHPKFEGERGYVPTYGKIPEIVLRAQHAVPGAPTRPGGRARPDTIPAISHTSPESRVAVNLEHIINDVREWGRAYLGMAPPPELGDHIPFDFHGGPIPQAKTKRY